MAYIFSAYFWIQSLCKNRREELIFGFLQEQTRRLLKRDWTDA